MLVLLSSHTFIESHKKCVPAGQYAVFAAFGILLAVGLARHQIYGDEAQAWLIARDSHGLMDLAGHLRYEGHPALWYLLLCIPAHLGWGVAAMKAINYVISLCLAWLVLGERRLSLGMRAAILFSAFVFFEMGVLSRPYMLAAVLLVGAARCLLAEYKRSWLAMVLLALAINTHFFAIPIAAGIFVWFYWFAPDLSWRTGVKRIKEPQFLGSVALIGLALAVCYFTLRPAPDTYESDYYRAGISLPGYLAIGVGQLWTDFASPVASLLRNFRLGGFLLPAMRPLWPATALTVVLWLLVIGSLRGRRSRWFLFTASLAWMAAVLFTVHIPAMHHVTLLFVAFVVALMADAETAEHKTLWPPLLAKSVLYSLLATQVSYGLFCAGKDLVKPYSSEEATTKWLIQNGLIRHPLVVEPDFAASGILAISGVRQAYFPSCRSMGQFVIWRRGRDPYRIVTAEELEDLRRQYGSGPVVLSRWAIPPDRLKALGLRLIYTSPHGTFWPEDMLVYGDDSSPVEGEASATR